jgi:hypothetical protein
MQDAARSAVENVVAVLCGHWPDPVNRVNPQVRQGDRWQGRHHSLEQNVSAEE